MALKYAVIQFKHQKGMSPPIETTVWSHDHEYHKIAQAARSKILNQFPLIHPANVSVISYVC